jgi:hypothetical protein
MALGAQTILTNASVTATADRASNFTTANIAAQTWTGFNLQVKVVNGSTASKSGEKLIINFGQSSFNTGSETVANVKALGQSAEITIPGEASLTTYYTLPITQRTGDYIYLWLGHESWDNARTVSISAVQSTP